jgi:hypothetical protein
MMDFESAAKALVVGLHDAGIPVKTIAMEQDANPGAIHINIGRRQ